METLVEACRDREVWIPRPQAYLGELVRNERDQSAGADGIGWLEVVRDGASVRTFGTGAFINSGSTNRTGLRNRNERRYDFVTLPKQRVYRSR